MLLTINALPSESKTVAYKRSLIPPPGLEIVPKGGLKVIEPIGWDNEGII
jgi:hypothetical protein